MEHLNSSLRNQFWNAFSNGVVPKHIDHQWLFGREAEWDALLHVVNQVIGDHISSFKLIEGSYGSGKSMLLSVFEREAISKGFVVARFALGSHNNFSKPEILYRDIMNNLKISNSDLPTDFENLFELWLLELKTHKSESDASRLIFELITELQSYHPSFASVLLVYIRGRISQDKELMEISAAWIKGDYNIPLEKKKRLNIKGNIDRYNAFDSLRGFSKLVSLLGFNGLVIMVDELEYIIRERVDIRDKAYTTMRHLIDEIGENTWINTIFIGAHTPEMMSNLEKGYRSYEALYQRIDRGFNDRGLLLNYKNRTIIPLKPLDKEAMLSIGKQIAKLGELKVESELLANLSYAEYVRKHLRHKQSQVEESYKNNTQVGTSVREYVKIVIQMVELAKTNPDMGIFQVNGQKS